MEKAIEETLKDFTKSKYFRETIRKFFMGGLNKCLDKRQPDIKDLKLIKFYFGENLKTKKLEKFEDSFRCYLYWAHPGIQNVFKRNIDKYNYEIIWQIDDDFYLFKLFDLNLYNKDQYYESEEYKKDCLMFDKFLKSLEFPIYYFFTKESFVCEHPKSITHTNGDPNLSIIANIQKIVPELVKEKKLLQNEFYICVIKNKGSTFYIQFETDSSESTVNIVDFPKEFKKKTDNPNCHIRVDDNEQNKSNEISDTRKKEISDAKQFVDSLSDEQCLKIFHILEKGMEEEEKKD